MKRVKFPEPKFKVMLGAILLKRFGFILVCTALLAMAGPVFAAGHVGHVDTDTYETDYTPADVDPAELYVDALGTTAVPDFEISADMPDGTWELQLLGGVEVQSGDLAGASSLIPQFSWAYGGELVGKFVDRGANMVLVQRSSGGTWDGFYGTLAFTIDPDHDQGDYTGRVIAVKAVSQEDSGGSGGGGGGCSTGIFAPAVLFLLAPLLLLRRRG